jgi:hypothetical protein
MEELIKAENVRKFDKIAGLVREEKDCAHDSQHG